MNQQSKNFRNASQNPTGFGAFLRQQRENMGLSRDQLATRVGLDVSHIFRLETGGRRPSRDTVLALADALSVDDRTVAHWVMTAGFAPIPAMGAVRSGMGTRGAMRLRVTSQRNTERGFWETSARARRLESIGLTETTVVGLLDVMSSCKLAEQRRAAEAISGTFEHVRNALGSSVKTAVIPAGGGQHRLIGTHVMQRLIINAIGEAVKAGISKIVLVLSPGSVESLYEPLRQLLEFVVVPPVLLLYCEQPKSDGLGDAILRSEALIHDHPFAVLLPDDVFPERIGKISGCQLRQMISVWERLKTASLIALSSVPRSRLLQGGAARITPRRTRENAFPIFELAEKPRVQDPISTASNVFGIVGRYILQPSVFEALYLLSKRQERPLELTEALAKMLNGGATVYGYKMATERCDVGVVLDEARALIGYARPL